MNELTNTYRDIVLNIFRASNLLERAGRTMTAGVGLFSVKQWFILGCLSHNEELSLKELKDNTLVTKQDMTGMIQRLKQSGHVMTREAENDRRMTKVKLTEKGREALLQLHQISRIQNTETFRRFQETELTTLSLLLGRLVSDLQMMPDESMQPSKQ